VQVRVVNELLEIDKISVMQNKVKKCGASTITANKSSFVANGLLVALAIGTACGISKRVQPLFS
jgi:hypothetical protein